MTTTDDARLVEIEARYGGEMAAFTRGRRGGLVAVFDRHVPVHVDRDYPDAERDHQAEAEQQAVPKGFH